MIDLSAASLPFSPLSSLSPLLAQEFSGWNGFLGSRASFMLDLVFLAMFAVTPLMYWAIRLAQHQRNYALHKRVQLLLATILLVAVVAFEIDVRFFTKWEERAADSPLYSPEGWSPVWIALVVHLCFAIPTAVLWVWVVVRALRGFPKPPKPSKHSKWHRQFGQFAAMGMLGTAVTGWLFYVLAFVI